MYWISRGLHPLFLEFFFTMMKSKQAKKLEEFFEKKVSRGISIKYLRCDNASEYQSKFHKFCEKQEFTLEYTTPHMPQFKGIIEIRFTLI